MHFQQYLIRPLTIATTHRVRPLYWLFVPVFLGLLLVIAGCGTNQEEAIIDTWQVSGKEQIIEFQQDGTMLVIDNTIEGEPQLYTGSYTFADASHITIEIAPEVFGLAEIYAEVDIRGNQMVLSGYFSAGSQAPTVFILER